MNQELSVYSFLELELENREKIIYQVLNSSIHGNCSAHLLNEVGKWFCFSVPENNFLFF